MKRAWLPLLIKQPSFPYTFSVLALTPVCHSASSLTMCGPWSIAIVPASVSRSYHFVQLLKIGTALGLIHCSLTWWNGMILYLIRCVCPFRKINYSQTTFFQLFGLVSVDSSLQPYLKGWLLITWPDCWRYLTSHVFSSLQSWILWKLRTWFVNSNPMNLQE